MSAETESIVLGVIALFAAVGTAVAIRRKTAKAAVACCIVVGGVLLLYGNLDQEAKRDAARQAKWRERQERLRASGPKKTSGDPSLILLPNGSASRSNEMNIGTFGGMREIGGDLTPREMQTAPGQNSGGGFRQGVPQRRRNPMSGPVPNGSPKSEDDQPPPPDTP